MDTKKILERIDTIEQEIIALHEENKYLKEALRLIYERNYEIYKQQHK